MDLQTRRRSSSWTLLPLRERLSLWWHGRLDAAYGIPSVDRRGRRPFTTPTVATLRSQFVLARRYAIISRDAEISRLRKQKAAEERRADDLETDLEAIRSAAIGWPTWTEQDRDRRRDFEAGLDITAVRRRRLGEHERARKELEAGSVRVREELRVTQARLAAIEAQIDGCRRAAERKIGAYRRMRELRTARYWRVLVRHHPQGGWLGLAGPRGLDAGPGWALGEELL